MTDAVTNARAERHPEEVKTVMSLIAESERAAVILAAASIDSSLEKLLKHVLHPCAGGSDSLFDGDRALGSFSAKILIAHRLGLIGNDFEHALQCLRRIRNDFAHNVNDASLSTGGHRDRLEILVRWARTNDSFEAALDATLNKWGAKSEAHAKFVVSMMIMMMALKHGIDVFKRVSVGAPPIKVG